MSYGQTDIGLQRSKNEDAFMMDEDRRVYAVADGLGGLPQGDLASQMAIEGLREHFKDNGESTDFRALFKKISGSINEVGLEIDQDFGIATTLTALKVEGDKAIVGHVGDTGIYVFKKDSYKQVTRDDTMAQDMKDNMKAGESTEIPDRFNHILTQCLGKDGDPRVQTYELELESGDRVLMYSDGVTKAFNAEELHELIYQKETPEAFVRTVIDLANERGGVDNTTAIAIYV